MTKARITGQMLFQTTRHVKALQATQSTNSNKGISRTERYPSFIHNWQPRERQSKELSFMTTASNSLRHITSVCQD